LRSGQGIAGAPHWQACGKEPKSDGNRSALHKTKTFIAAFTVGSHHGAIAGKISFRTAVDLNSQANALFVSAIPSKVDRSRHFLIIESGASRTLRYPQHIRGVNAPVLIACCRATTSIKYARAQSRRPAEHAAVLQYRHRQGWRAAVRPTAAVSGSAWSLKASRSKRVFPAPGSQLFSSPRAVALRST
jgi:hypothetical protein